MALLADCSSIPNDLWTAGQAIEPESVLAQLEDQHADLSARVCEVFADHFWPSALTVTVWVAPGTYVPQVKLTTIPELAAMVPDGLDSASVFGEWVPLAEVRQSGILAEVRVRYEAKFGEPGALMNWCGVDRIILLLHQGRWRTVSLAYAPEHQWPALWCQYTDCDLTVREANLLDVLVRIATVAVPDPIGGG